MTKSSIENTVYDTGAQRDSRKNKLSFSLMPHAELIRVLKRYQEGADTYGRNNWIKGMTMSTYYDSAMRHIISYWQGDTSEDHAAAAIWNIFAMMHTEKNNTLLDDRTNYPRL